ncbi:MAG: hypothetical protein ACFFCW_36360, partial [Candidatus Hodarchaeota archaeon]
MKKIYIAIVLAAVSGLVGTSYADQVNVNIAYPLNGESYKISPDYPFLTISFSVTCKDFKDRNVEWGYNSETLGKAKFRGQISLQFLQKFSEGVWLIWVESDCGK